MGIGQTPGDVAVGTIAPAETAMDVQVAPDYGPVADSSKEVIVHPEDVALVGPQIAELFAPEIAKQVTAEVVSGKLPTSRVKSRIKELSANVFRRVARPATVLVSAKSDLPALMDEAVAEFGAPDVGGRSAGRMSEVERWAYGNPQNFPPGALQGIDLSGLTKWLLPAGVAIAVLLYLRGGKKK